MRIVMIVMRLLVGLGRMERARLFRRAALGRRVSVAIA
jgi:hypothetical protein